MSYLRVDASIRQHGSVSRELTGAVERAWRAADPGAEVVHRDLAAEPCLAGTWQQATLARFVPDELRTRDLREATAVATAVAEEALAATAIVVGAPLYNFGVPAVVKSWIDVLVVDPRFDPAAPRPALAGVPVSLVVACGGSYRPGTPRAGWDHATPWMQRIFADVFGAEVTLIVAELTAAGMDPTLAGLRPQAERSRADARALAVATATTQAAGRPSRTAATRRSPA